MVVEAVHTEQTWRLLWSHASYQVVFASSPIEGYECVCAGYGWGLRCASDRQRALVVHPSAEGREIGDLTLTILGVGKQVIPRYGRDFPRYLAAVRDAVETAARIHL